MVIPRSLKLALAILLPLSLLLMVFLWFYNHAYIEVSVLNPKGNLTTVTLKNQRTGTTTSFTTGTADPIKKLVTRGDYEVLGTQSNQSSFVITAADGFLSVTPVSLTLQGEKAREFVGDNPGSCMFYTGQVLISGNCVAPFREAVLHNPATTSQPTYAAHSPILYNDALEGIVRTNQGAMALLHSLDEEDGYNFAHRLFNLQPDLNLTNEKTLSDLNNQLTYYIHSYKTGFVVYDESFSDVRYYASASAKPSLITTDKTTDLELSPYYVDFHGDTILAAYPVNLVEGTSTNATNKKKPTSRIVIVGDGPKREYRFNRLYASATACGSNKLCLLGDKTLEVYDVTGDKPKLLYRVTSVESVHSSSKGLLVAREHEVINFDVERQLGFSEYSLGSYGYCGLQVDPEGYTLCLTNEQKKKLALHVNQQASDTDSIDKKIAELVKAPEIEVLNIYKNLIYLAPKTGPLLHDDETGLFDVDPVAQKRANERINQAIKKSGIDLTRYHVTNTSTQ